MDNELMTFLNEKAQYIENERLKAVKKNYFYRFVKPLCNLLIVVLTILVVINIILPIFLPLTIVLGIIFIALLFVDDPKDVFESKVKEEILPTVCSSINSTYKYYPYSYNKKTLLDSEILSKGYFANTIAIQGEDHLKGQIENIDVEFFEINFFKKVTNYTKTAGGCLLSLVLIPIVIFKSIFHNNMQTNDILFGVIKDTKLFFSGFFMHADFHKDFQGKVLMIPKNKDSRTDQIYEIFEPKTLTKMNIENPYINDNYNIYTSNIQTGYYVLSQNLIDRIHAISDRENTFPIISFINGKMYFAIPWNKNFLSFNINTKIENGSFFLPYIDEINSFEKIVKDLNLNTRIWTKA
jgi:hypothetical protein